MYPTTPCSLYSYYKCSISTNISNTETRELPLCFIFLHNWLSSQDPAHSKRRLPSRSQMKFANANLQQGLLIHSLANGEFNLYCVTKIRAEPTHSLFLILHMWRSQVFIKLYLWDTPSLASLQKGLLAVTEAGENNLVWTMAGCPPTARTKPKTMNGIRAVHLGVVSLRTCFT